MSRHEGVSCDSCLKGNFRGKRYKCLICYDYDLCATCYEAGTTTSRHTTEHPMQCILTRSDFDLYYGGEAVPVEQPQSFTCPFCGKMGFTETTLQEHVTAEHSDASFEVICPVCAALPGGDPNNVTDDFAAHLTLEHRTPHDLISFINPVQDEPSGARHVRRIPHPGRGVGGTRARRTNMHFSSSSGLSALSPSNRESMDPISELLSQLSVVRRSATSAQSSTSSQLHQLQMQLRLERQQAQVARQQLERLPRRQAQTNSSTAATAAATSNTTVIGTGNTLASILDTSTNSALANNSQFLLSRFTEPPPSESEQQALETERADHSLFVQELLLSTLAEQSTPDESEDHDDFESKDSSLSSRDSEHIGNDRSRDSQPQGGAGTSGLGNLANSKTSPISNKKVQTTSPAPSMGAKATSRTSPSASREHQSYPQQMGVVTGVPASGGAATRNPLGSGSVGSSRASPSVREQHPGGTTLNRSAARSASSASPASTRRKVYRHVEDRNKTEKEPPPH